MWRLRAVDFDDFGADVEYECELCEEVLAVPPDGEHPPLL